MKYSREKIIELLTRYGKGIPVRRRDKQTKFFVDNEAIENGYAKAFGRNWLVYDVLAKHADSKLQACFLSYDTLLKETGFESRNVIAGVIAALVELNIIAIRAVPGIKSNAYYLVDASKWRPVTSIMGATGRIVLKRGVKQYLNQQKTSGVDDTLNLRIKSPQEIKDNKVLKENGKYESLKPIDDGTEGRNKKALENFRAWGRSRGWNKE